VPLTWIDPACAAPAARTKTSGKPPKRAITRSYRDTATPRKRTAKAERIVLNAFLLHLFLSHPAHPRIAVTNAGVSITERMPWLGTVRGRVGYAADRLLLYATGGLAYGRVEVDSSASATGLFEPIIPGAIPCPSGGPCQVWDFSGSGVTKVGWTAGAGAE